MRLTRALFSLKPRFVMPSHPNINLTSTEDQFVRHLDAFSSRLNPPVECRIAGGWVRDKLLALPSHDLDIALSISSGYDFAMAFVDYLKSQNISTGSVGKVAVNPEQSKHLETGTTRIMGLECDFVGLRSETYADSRIPTEVRLGTPQEDASRRDLTINALFYNVHSKEVEDFTGRGLDDLSNKVARTPLAPEQTFYDDPLRVLRCVRFASRYDLAIDPEVAAAIRDPGVKAALRDKVSKERIGIEVSKMLQKSPFEALTLIDSLELHRSIFTCSVDPPRDQVMVVSRILRNVLQRMNGDDVLWFGAAVSPFEGLTIKGKKELPAAYIVIQEGLKLGNDIRDSVTRLFAAPDLIDPKATQRSVIGTTLQHQSVRPWRRSIVWAIVKGVLPHWNGAWDAQCEKVFNEYLQFMARVEDLNLEHDIDRPPILDGNTVQKVLNIRPSPILAPIRDAVLKWQLDNPTGTQEECEVWLKRRWEDGGKEEWESSVHSAKRKR